MIAWKLDGSTVVTNMGLDDIVGDKEEEKEEESVEEMKEELGVEDEGDLEELNDRMRRMVETVSKLDKNIERLENELTVTRGALAKVLQDMNKMYEDSSVESPQQTVEGSTGEEDEDDSGSSGWEGWE